MPQKITAGVTVAGASPGQTLALAAVPLVFVAAATLTLSAASALSRRAAQAAVPAEPAHAAVRSADFRGSAPPPEALRAVRRAQEKAYARARSQQQATTRRAGGAPYQAYGDEWRWAGI